MFATNTRLKLPDKVSSKRAFSAMLKGASKRPFPSNLRPMLATLVNEPFSSPNWSYEMKWDGYRALAFINNGHVELKSRNSKSFNDKFYSIYNALQQWRINAVVDGEIVVTDSKGLSNFGALQNWRSEADGPLIFYVFDVLWLDGMDVTQLPLSQRRKVLQSILPADDIIRFSMNFDEAGKKAFETALKLGFEGIMAKKNDSIYIPGERSKEWLKLKANKRQEVVIGGYTQNQGSNRPFSSLLVGMFDGNKLHYAGKVGTGFSIETQKELIQQFKPLIRTSNPFSTMPDINSPSRFRPEPPKATATWLRPKLVCEVSFAEMTSDQVMRHPSFEGMRIDKKASDVVLERAAETTKLTTGHKTLVNKKIIAPSRNRERKTLLNPTDESQVRNIGGHDLKLSNLSKLYWPEDKISKRDLLNYYYQVAPYILPYLKDRPQSLNRHPNGIHGEHFYQKDVKGKVPDWVSTFRYFSKIDKREKEFFICNDEASLIYLASIGCIEISPWNSKGHTPNNPDWCVIDFDPDRNTFNQVIRVARVTHELLDSIGVPSYCKTSGATGLHIYIPLGAKYTYEESKEFARAIVTVVHSELPRITSIERQIADRHGKMYLDFLQNRPQATIVAPYSVRPQPHATVSMPLHWDEVKTNLRMTDFTIRNAVQRVGRERDIFKPILGKGIDLGKSLKKLQAIAPRQLIENV